MRVIEPSVAFDRNELFTPESVRDGKRGYSMLTTPRTERFDWNQDWKENGDFLLSLLRDKDPRIFELIEAGHSSDTIARYTGFSEKTVIRIRTIIRSGHASPWIDSEKTTVFFPVVVRSKIKEVAETNFKPTRTQIKAEIERYRARHPKPRRVYYRGHPYCYVSRILPFIPEVGTYFKPRGCFAQT